LDPKKSIMDNVTGGSGDTVTIDGRARHVSSYLRDFLFPPERLHAPVSMLSGGERNRLLLARLFARPSNLLVMDEPTNDLDADTLDLLEEMVAEYTGTLLLVSHDRAFLDNVVTSTLVFEGGGRVNEYVGGYTDWLRQRRVSSGAAGRTPSTTVFAAPATSRPVLQPAAPQPAAPKPRKLSYKDQRELDALPATIQKLEAEQATLVAVIADPELFRRNLAEANAAVTRLQAVEKELEAAFARWETLEAPI
jgi:ABC transport system ATP-binding/permease protein